MDKTIHHQNFYNETRKDATVYQEDYIKWLEGKVALSLLMSDEFHCAMEDCLSAEPCKNMV